MSGRRLLFPLESRRFRGQRWVNISLRTLHLIGVAGMAGGILHAGSGIHQWGVWYYLMLISGSLLALLYLWTNGIWLLQLCGQAVLLKILLLAMMWVWPLYEGVWVVAAIVISGLISHAPGDVRYYSVFYRRRLDH